MGCCASTIVVPAGTGSCTSASRCDQHPHTTNPFSPCTTACSLPTHACTNANPTLYPAGIPIAPRPCPHCAPFYQHPRHIYPFSYAPSPDFEGYEPPPQDDSAQRSRLWRYRHRPLKNYSHGPAYQGPQHVPGAVALPDPASSDSTASSEYHLLRSHHDRYSKSPKRHHKVLLVEVDGKSRRYSRGSRSKRDRIRHHANHAHSDSDSYSDSSEPDTRPEHRRHRGRRRRRHGRHRHHGRHRTTRRHSRHSSSASSAYSHAESNNNPVEGSNDNEVLSQHDTNQDDENVENANDGSAHNSGSDNDDAVYVSESDVTAEGAGVVVVEDVATLVIGNPDVVLQRALDRANRVDDMDAAAITQTVYILEEGLKEANKQIQRRDRRRAVAARAASSRFRRGDGIDAGGNDNHQGDTNAAPDVNNNNDIDSGENNGDHDRDSGLSSDSDSDSDVVDSMKLAQAYQLLARLYGLHRNESRSLSRSVSAFEKSLQHLGSKESDPLMWASLHMSLANSCLSQDESLEPSLLDATGGIDAEHHAARSGHVTPRFCGDETLRTTKAIRHARMALEVYERDSTPSMFAGAYVVLGEAYARRVDLLSSSDVGEDDYHSLEELKFSIQGITYQFSEVQCHVCACLLAAKHCYEEALSAVSRLIDEVEWARLHTWLAHLALRYRKHLRGLARPIQYVNISDSQHRRILQIRGRHHVPGISDAEAGPSSSAADSSSKQVQEPQSGSSPSRNRHIVDPQFGVDAAIEHLRSASEVYGRQEKPVHYGNIQHSIATAHVACSEDIILLYNSTFFEDLGSAEADAAALSSRPLGEKIPRFLDKIMRRHLSRAVKAFKNALSVKSWSYNAGFDYSVTIQHLADAQQRLAALPPVDATAESLESGDDEADGSTDES